MNSVLLKIENLNKTFKKEPEPAISDFNFELKQGETAALIGPDGAGKTTLLRLIAGLIYPDNICKNQTDNSKVVTIDGFSPYKNLSDTKKIIGYMPQTFGLYEDLTVLENLELFGGLKNVNKKEEEELFETLLKFAGLNEFKTRLAGNLSGGMKQKLGLSCTLLSKPKLLLLDEPSVGVDPISRKELLNITENLATKNKMGIIWATSYLDEAVYFDKAILISNGKKIFDGKPKDAKSAMNGLVYFVSDKNKQNREFLDEIVKNEKGLVDATIEGQKIRVIFENKKFSENFSYKKEPAEPIFEDFVMSALGAKIKAPDTEIKEITASPPNNIAIEANNLTKKYGNFTATSNISFKITKGEIFGLLGPNGAGKSTTFKMLCALIKPTEGSSTVMGYDILKNPIEAKKNFGYMAQKFSLFGNLSVRQNLDFFMGVYGTKRRDIKEVLSEYELDKYIDKNASELPLGFKQRLALLCAVIHEPPVLFLDEPTSGVDPISRREFWMRINGLVKKGTTVLVTTHFMDEAQFCDRIALVNRGKILVADKPDNLKNSVKTKELQNPTMEDAFIKIIEERG